MKKDVNSKYVAELKNIWNKGGTYRSKCRRNLRMYEYSPTISMENLTDEEVVGYYQQGRFDIEDDTTSSVQQNVIKTCIDTLTSKIASKKVRPFLNTVNGSFRDMQIVKQAQLYFDQISDEQNWNKQITLAFKDACIFDRGVIYIDVKNKVAKRVMPWQIQVLSSEASYNDIKHLVWKQDDVISKDNINKYTTVWHYWNLEEKKHIVYREEENEYIEETWKDELPFVFIYYTDPVKGYSASSVVDQLYGIQLEIDALVNKIKDASQLSDPLTYFVPEGSGIRTSKLSNRIGNVVQYTATPNMTGSPVTVATHPFMDPQWFEALRQFKEDAYELVGISQLSATSQKPKGLDSGVALATMEDIESDRFETQLNNVIRAYTDIAKKCISLFPEDEDILPPNRNRNSIKWFDIVEAKDMLVIQFSAAESLSKDPSTKLQQLLAFNAAGLIPKSRIAQLMEIPDLQQGYSLANNAINAVMSVIDDCIERDIYDIPDYIPLQMLQEEILSTCLSLRASNHKGNREDINKLMKLYDISMNKDVNAMTNMEMAITTQLGQAVNEQMQNAMNNGSFDAALNGNYQPSNYMGQEQAQALMGNVV